ncbi:MAG TPA: YihY/virulence factor BrkB family protein, partial [Flavisolibacter sp.]|nr:YihY/virulence factor BrkB family protein [Flavisolibacter sp.]
NFLKKLSDRLRSILVILGAGILFVFGIVTEGMEALVGNYIRAISPVLAFYFTSAFNYVFSILIVTLWFSILFRYIPDGRPNWKVALTGAFLTSILFNIGKFLLRILLGASNINTLYGASGSIVLLLLFVFYSSFILYFGAAFTKMWSIHNGAHIAALPYASHYQLTEVPEDDE